MANLMEGDSAGNGANETGSSLGSEVNSVSQDGVADKNSASRRKIIRKWTPAYRGRPKPLEPRFAKKQRRLAEAKRSRLRKWIRLFRRRARPRIVRTNLEYCVNLLRWRAAGYFVAAAVDVLMIVLALNFMSSSFAIADRVSRLEEGVLEDAANQHEMSERVEKMVLAFNNFSSFFHEGGIDPENPKPGVEALQRRFDTLRAEMPSASGWRRAPISDLRFIVHVASVWLARMGILVCGFFFIQIFVFRYRYNSRMSGQYGAMADALILATDGGQLKFAALISALTPKSDFGVAPKPIVHELIEALKGGSGSPKSGADVKKEE